MIVHLDYLEFGQQKCGRHSSSSFDLELFTSTVVLLETPHLIELWLTILIISKNTKIEGQFIL